MKILLLCQYNPFFETSASANRLNGLINGLRCLGHSITIIVIGGYISPKEKDELQEDVIYFSKANHFSYWLSRINIYILDVFYQQANTRRLVRMDISSFDIVWLTCSSVVLNCFLKIKDKIKAKTFIEFNEFNDIYVSNSGNILQKIKGSKSNIVFKKSIEYIDLFGVMTKTLLNYYPKLTKPEAKFLHLPMTVDMSRFENVGKMMEYSKPYVAFTGSFNNAKDGVDILIKAFALIFKKYPSLNLYLAGFWHYDVPGQELLIKQLEIGSRVHYLGILNRDQIPPFVCNASVLALPRPDSHQAKGGFPTKLGEYLATGNPVCVTKVGEIPDYLEDNVSAFFAEPGDVASFADALDRALSNTENSKRVGLNGRKTAELEFDAMFHAKRLALFLEDKL